MAIQNVNIQYRVTFKTAIVVYSLKNTGKHAYLCQILQDYEPVRSLVRSSSMSFQFQHHFYE